MRAAARGVADAPPPESPHAGGTQAAPVAYTPAHGTAKARALNPADEPANGYVPEPLPSIRASIDRAMDRPHRSRLRTAESLARRPSRTRLGGRLGRTTQATRSPELSRSRQSARRPYRKAMRRPPGATRRRSGEATRRRSGEATRRRSRGPTGRTAPAPVPAPSSTPTRPRWCRPHRRKSDPAPRRPAWVRQRAQSAHRPVL